MSAAAVAQPKVLLFLLILMGLIGGIAYIATDAERNPYVLEFQRYRDNHLVWDPAGRYPNKEICRARGLSKQAKMRRPRPFRCQYDPEGDICGLILKPCGGIF